MRPRYFAVSIAPAGVRWSGRCCVTDGVLEVCSAWGWASRPVGRHKPRLLAEALMVEILAAKLAALEAERQA